MAHQLTEAEVDQLASEEAAFDKARIDELAADAAAALPPAGPTLAIGAEGADVTRLVNLLNVLGYSTNDVIKGGAPKLDESVLTDAKAAQAALAVVEPVADTVGPATWGALYEAAGAKLEGGSASA